MEPLLLPKEICDAINYFRNPPKGIYTNWSNKEIIDCVLKPNTYHEDYELTLEILRSASFDDLMYALVNGCEPEETKEDRARKYYKEQNELVWNHDNRDTSTFAMTQLLNILEIEVEGISDQKFER